MHAQTHLSAILQEMECLYTNINFYSSTHIIANKIMIIWEQYAP